MNMPSSLSSGSSERWPLRKPFHSRRSHNKSRKGCQPCKSAKLKCGEEQPVCRRCTSRSLVCRYGGRSESQRPPLRHITRKPTLERSPQYIAMPREDAELWHHFATMTWDTFADPCVNAVILQSLDLAIHSDHLKHAVLALAATHQRYLRADHCPDDLVERHLSRSITLFRTRLATPPTASTMDAVLLTSLILNTQNFFLHQHSSPGLWIKADSEGWRWLTLLSGWQTLLLQHKDWLSTSVWAKTMQRIPSRQQIASYSASRSTKDMLSSIPSEWKIAFGLSENDDPDGSPYMKALHSLAGLMACQDRERLLRQIMTFAYRLEPRLLTLLHKREPSAVCIIAMWLGCMCQFDLWWLAGRATSECYAACEYLDICASDTMRRILKDTAQACGYPLGQSGTYKELCEGYQPGAVSHQLSI